MARINIKKFCNRISLESYTSYTVDDLLEYVKGKPTFDLDLDKLKWQYPHDRISKKRLAGIVIDGFPIIVEALDDGDYRTLDGFHRAYVAIKEGRRNIKAYLITEKDIAVLNRNANKR